MKRAILALLLLAISVHAQSRADIGLHVAGDRDRGYKDVAAGISARGVFRFGPMALDGTVDWTFHAPKVGPAPEGRTLTTTFYLRRYVFNRLYVVGGVDINKLSSVLLDTTATSAATGIGAEVGNVRLQAIYEAPDFTSGQTLSHYRVEAEYLWRFGANGYVSFRQQGTVARFDRDGKPGTLTGERVGLTISVGRLF